MPADLLLYAGGDRAEQRLLVGREPLGVLGRNLLGGVGGAHRHHGVAMDHPGDQLGERRGFREDRRNDLRHAADRAPVATGE
jgi:hypothetical protein